MPTSLSEYHDLVAEALRNPQFNESYRRRGLQAVGERHTYAHRARHILRLLGLEGSIPAGTAADGRKPGS